MIRAELLKCLDVLGDEESNPNDWTEAYWKLNEFIVQNTKAEEKIPALLKGGVDGP